eukprot:jgi/Mesen1/810/ME000110S_11077
MSLTDIFELLFEVIEPVVRAYAARPWFQARPNNNMNVEPAAPRPVGLRGQDQRPPAVAAASPEVSMASFFSTIAIFLAIPEGHVGVYWRGGALLNSITEPGFHMMLPFVTTYEAIQVTLQTDQVANIPCGTRGGVMIYFEKIEVVNRLRKEHVHRTIMDYGVEYDRTWIYDKIHHEINQFCSSHSLQEVYIDLFDQIDEQIREAIQKDLVKYAPGIEVIGVLIAIEKQKVVEKEAETEKKRAVSDAEKAAHVSRILMEQRLQEKESTKRTQEIENEIYVARQASLTDAHFYRVGKEAEANRLMLTPEYLELRFIEAISNNTKMFFGEKVPNMVWDQRLLESVTARNHVRAEK